MHISQPPLSRQIKELEHELGTALFNRLGKRIELTEAGLFLKDEAKKLLEQASYIQRRVKIIGENPDIRIRIGYVGSIMFSLFPELLAFLKGKMPGLAIDLFELSTEQQVDALCAGNIDLGFLRSWVNTRRVRYETLGSETLSIVYPSSMQIHLEKRNVLKQFEHKPFISFLHSNAPGLFEVIMNICKTAGFAPHVTYEASQFFFIIRLVHAGLGWSIVPTYTLRNMDTGGVNIVELEDSITLGLAYRKGRLSSKIQDIIDLSKEFWMEYIDS